MRLFANASFDFLRFRRIALVITAVFTVPGLLLAVLRGLDFSIEFTGGTLVQVEASETVPIGDVRAALVSAGLTGAEIQTYGSERAYVIRARLDAGDASDPTGNTQAVAAAVSNALTTAFGADQFTVLRTEAVGPKVGGELRQKAISAVLFSFLAVLAYLAFRFEWRFGLAAVLATVHDILATFAFLAYTRIEVSLVVVAALLTIVGYSLNDTIVIFDRVRENLRKYKRDNFDAILNRSINETLPRTVVTSGTTLAALLAILLLGGAVVKAFAASLFFGVLTGTFSSIYIASPVLLRIERRWPGADARGARTLAAPAEPA
jgi:preprotein translocase subunit SecF